MKVDSLFDEAGTYVGIYNADGFLIGHEYGGNLSIKEPEAVEVEEEIINEHQLNLF